MNSKKFNYLVLGVILIASSLACASHPEAHKGEKKHPEKSMERRHMKFMESFRMMDSDEDGRISQTEFFASPRMVNLADEKRQAIFTRLDHDKDGFLIPPELLAKRHDTEMKMREDFRKLDTDYSGGVNFEEFSKGRLSSKLPDEKRRHIFQRMDSDKDGEITAKDRPEPPIFKHPHPHHKKSTP